MTALLGDDLALNRHSQQSEVADDVEDLMPDKFVVESKRRFIQHAVRRENDGILSRASESKVCLSQHLDFLYEPGVVVRSFRLFAALSLALAISACAGTGQDPNGLGAGMNAATPGSTQDFTVNVGDRVFFQEDQSTLTAEAQATLEKQAMWLRQYPQYVFTIEGHADERGTREYNIALGAKRATAVRNFLAQHGINAQRVRTISYGKERPVAVCNDISCWSQNRRVVTVLNASS